MTEVYARDLSGMKYAILKSPYHKKVVTACAEMLGVPPMLVRRMCIERLDMMTLESLGARYDSWKERGDTEGGIKRAIGYDLFTSFIPIIAPEIMDQALECAYRSGGDPAHAQAFLREKLVEGVI